MIFLRIPQMTAGEFREEDETDEIYCICNGVPREMVDYLQKS